MPIFKAIAKGYNKVLSTTFAISGYLILAIFVLICIQVFSRYLPVPPLLWTTDIAIFCLVLLGFIGMANLLRKGAHVAIDILVDHLPLRTAETIGIIVCVIGAITTVITAYVALDVTINQFERGVFLSGSSFNMPKWILLAIIPFGFFSTFIEFVVLIREHFLKLLALGSETK